MKNEYISNPFKLVLPSRPDQPPMLSCIHFHRQLWSLRHKTFLFALKIFRFGKCLNIFIKRKFPTIIGGAAGGELNFIRIEVPHNFGRGKAGDCHGNTFLRWDNHNILICRWCQIFFLSLPFVLQTLWLEGWTPLLCTCRSASLCDPPVGRQ